MLSVIRVTVMLLLLMGWTSSSFAQTATTHFFSIQSGLSVPAEGYDGYAWENERHIQIEYGQQVAPNLWMGTVGSYDQQRQGDFRVELTSLVVRGAYGGLATPTTAFIPYVEAGGSRVHYVSEVPDMEGGWQLAPRIGFGAALRQRLWSPVTLVGEMAYHVVLGEFEGYRYAGVPLPYQMPTVAPPRRHSFTYGVYRLGLALSL